MRILKISLFIATTIILSFFWLSEDKSVTVESCKSCANEFSSGYYTEYHNQLRSFLLEHPQIKNIIDSSGEARALFTNIVNPLGDAIEQRHIHEDFVHQLRAALRSTPPRQESFNQFLYELTKWIYLKAEMRKAAGVYLDSILSVPPESDYSHLLIMLQELRKNREFSRSPHETSHMIDQYADGNLPSLLFTLQNPWQTAVLRMGYPMNTINKLHLPLVKPKLYPEFAAFLQNQPSHLYINLMKRKGSESSASRALEELEDLFPHLMVVTLDKNSDFYWQDKHLYPETMHSVEFKQLLLNQFTDHGGNFYWSAHLEKEFWTEKLKNLIDEVHLNFFANETYLNQKERLDFIEISYLSILDALVEALQPASMNITCRQCMDRGPSLYALWMLQKNEVSLEELPALLLSPPLLIHNRPSHPSRIKRFISAAQKISSSQ